MVFSALPPVTVLKTMVTAPFADPVILERKDIGGVAYLSVVRLTQVLLCATIDFPNAALFVQGRAQVLPAAVTGLEPKQPYVLALASQASGGGILEPLAAFTTNPAGAAIVNAVGPIRQIVRGDARTPRRYLVIVSGMPGQLGARVQVQAP